MWILYQYIKPLSNFYGLKGFIAPKMMDIITYIENPVKDASYSRSDIHYIYHYLCMIGAPTTLDYSGQNSNSFDPNTNSDS